MMKPFSVLAAVLACAQWCQALAPANPNTTAKGKAILDYLAALPAHADKRVVSGQFTDFGGNSNLAILDETKRVGGHYPGLMGGDYADFGRNFVTSNGVNKTAIAYWKAGGLVTLSAHVPHPLGGGFRDRDVDLAQLLVPGTEANKNWTRVLDSMAAGLQALRDAGVVVLWRPFHEMNGEWFWWNGKDSAAFVGLWRHMFEYYSKDKGLNNLLWVYGPNMGARVTKYYPGDKYADITGLDGYTDNVDSNTIKGYGELIKLGKPFGFTEFGPHGPENPPGDFDYRKLIDGIRKDFPRTCFFMSWNAKWSLPQNRFAKELLEDPWIVNREDLDFSAGIAIRSGPRARAKAAGSGLGLGMARWFAAGTDYADAMGRSIPMER
ncbi:MAG: Mannan endo,4-beta-mannosidase [Fibrobacteres bacterium]|nr:Mannan endo,4-beta-mannosidase [Fibrobacterota bacterium]